MPSPPPCLEVSSYFQYKRRQNVHTPNQKNPIQTFSTIRKLIRHKLNFIFLDNYNRMGKVMVDVGKLCLKGGLKEKPTNHKIKLILLIRSLKNLTDRIFFDRNNNTRSDRNFNTVFYFV